MTITSLQFVKMKVPVGKPQTKNAKAKPKTKLEMVIQIVLSGDVSGAGNLGAYKLFLGKTKKRSTTFKTPVPLVSATYAPSEDTLTLVPAGKLNLTRPEELTVSAALLTDLYGRALDGLRRPGRWQLQRHLQEPGHHISSSR